MNAKTMTYRIEQSCKDWLNNKVTALTLLIHANKVRKSSDVLRYQIFVDDLESYFLDRRADARVWRAIRYLKLYLKCYPYTQAKAHKATAMHMLGIIYCSLGIDEVARLTNGEAIRTLEPIASCQDYLDSTECSKSKIKIGRY